MADRPRRDGGGAEPSASPPWRVIEPPDGARRVRAKASPASDAGTGALATAEEVDTTSGAAAGRRTREPDPRLKALELLARREHSRRELTRKLADRGFDADAAARAVGDMAERGWQDDARFAESLARSRMHAGHGPLRIRAELRLHGIGEDGIEAALAACEVDWNTQAADLLRRRFGTGEAPSRQETARRGAFLQRRGFDLGAIRYALSLSED